jgi:hypothetical protein
MTENEIATVIVMPHYEFIEHLGRVCWSLCTRLRSTMNYKNEG